MVGSVHENTRIIPDGILIIPNIPISFIGWAANLCEGYASKPGAHIVNVQKPERKVAVDVGIFALEFEWYLWYVWYKPGVRSCDHVWLERCGEYRFSCLGLFGGQSHDFGAQNRKWVPLPISLPMDFYLQTNFLV